MVSLHSNRNPNWDRSLDLTPANCSSDLHMCAEAHTHLNLSNKKFKKYFLKKY